MRPWDWQAQESHSGCWSGPGWRGKVSNRGGNLRRPRRTGAEWAWAWVLAWGSSPIGLLLRIVLRCWNSGLVSYFQQVQEKTSKFSNFKLTFISFWAQLALTRSTRMKYYIQKSFYKSLDIHIVCENHLNTDEIISACVLLALSFLSAAF